MNTINIMIKNIEVFEKAPVPKAVFKMAIPTVLSMIVSVFYNMVDAFFVGLIGDPSQFAAVNVATPVFLVLMAAGNIFGMGGSSFISRSLGRREYDLVKKISSFCFYTGIGTGITGGALLLIFITKILNAIGTTEGTFIYAKQYLSLVAWGGPIIVVSNAFTNIIRGEGAAKNSMKGMMAGTIVNIILDPIFILKDLFGIKLLGLGVEGAALATIIGNAVTLAIYLIHVVSKSSMLSINPRFYQARHGIMAGVFSIGLPASITNILMSLSSIVTNNLLASYYYVKITNEALLEKATTYFDSTTQHVIKWSTVIGGYVEVLKNESGQLVETAIASIPAGAEKIYGDVPTCAMGVALKANMLALFIMLGIAMGVSPLIGYNYGSRNLKRMKAILKFALLCNFVAGSSVTILYWIFTTPVIKVFSSDPAVILMGHPMIYSLMASIPILGFLFCFNFTFQAIGKGRQSLILAISRQGFVFFPLIFIMNHYIGLYGIVWAQPVADAVSVIMAIVMFRGLNKDFKEIEEEHEALQVLEN